MKVNSLGRKGFSLCLVPTCWWGVVQNAGLAQRTASEVEREHRFAGRQAAGAELVQRSRFFRNWLCHLPPVLIARQRRNRPTPQRSVRRMHQRWSLMGSTRPMATAEPPKYSVHIYPALSRGKPVSWAGDSADVRSLRNRLSKRRCGLPPREGRGRMGDTRSALSLRNDGGAK
jgi:hypothetical protein